MLFQAALGIVFYNMFNSNNSYCYDHRTKKLLDLSCTQLESMTFFTGIWQCVTSTPTIRLPALLYMTSCIDRQQPASEQLFVIGNDKSVVVSIFI